jgi:hypothetical protein
MSAPWSQEEISWARECFWAGDTLEEIAKIACRPVHEVVGVLGAARNLTARQREVLSLFSAGCTYAEIDKVCGNTRCRPGAAAASIVTALRKRGGELGYRQHGRRSQEAHA